MTFLRALRDSVLHLGIAVLVAVQAVATLLVFGPGFGLGMVFLLTQPIVWLRRATNHWRRFMSRRTGRPIPAPYAPPPGPPVQESDGLYRNDASLYKSARVATFMSRLDWILHDRYTGRDLVWSLLHPFIAGFLALVPFAPVLAPLFGAPLWTLWLAPVGVAVAPVTVALIDRWTVRALSPLSEGSLERSERRDARTRGAMINFVKVLALVALCLVDIPFALVTVAGVVLGYGTGLIFLVPVVLVSGRWLANLRRSLAGTFSGVEIPRPYAVWQQPALRPDGMYRVGTRLFKTEFMATAFARHRWITTDPATWRDLLWLVVDPVVTAVLLGVPCLIAGYGIWGLAIPSTWKAFVGPHTGWYGALDGNSWVAFPVGIVLGVTGLILTSVLLRPHGRWTRVLLAPTRAAVLSGRVARLTKDRADSIDARQTEIQRIERDLHDGAQARLIAVGLTLGAIERLMDTDPEAARLLLSQAQSTSAAALTELRDLVRGIHPPVLSERGLADAVRALALDSTVPAEVDIDVPGRLDAPVESAVYFAVSETLTNVARHAAAGQVRITLRHEAGVLRVTIVDDGTGGADPSRGTGLRGIQRRLANFDGTVVLDSPEGGPTTVTMEVPCESSSRKISTSSETV
jgi:signal transduction histidine kinase